METMAVSLGSIPIRSVATNRQPTRPDEARCCVPRLVHPDRLLLVAQVINSPGHPIADGGRAFGPSRGMWPSKPDGPTSISAAQVREHVIGKGRSITTITSAHSARADT